MKTLLITGGSSGIGLAAVQLFVAKGWQVIELSRSGQSSPSVVHIPCDVTSEQSVQAAVAEAMNHTSHLDVVISNAGFGISGPIEFTSVEEAQKQFDVNLFGAMRLVRAVLPILRQQHSASKSALNAMALALANEVRTFGIRVSVLMPGDVATGFTDAREKSIKGAEVYLGAQSAVEAMERDERAGMTPMQMARCLYRMATTKCPKPIYIGGFVYSIFCLLNRLLPKRLVNWIVGKLYC